MRAKLSGLYHDWRQRLWGNAGRLDPDAFLADTAGVIHVGASEGQERELYDSHGLNVIWIEPIPSVYRRLCANIASLRKQRAVQCLISDQDDQPLTLNISSNDGHSSSIFELAGHQQIWPEVSFIDRIQMTSITLDSLSAREGWDLSLYGSLIVDAQGADLLVLRGATQTLKTIRHIKIEAANFPAYRGASLDTEIVEFLGQQGFVERHRVVFAERQGIGMYFDLFFERR